MPTANDCHALHGVGGITKYDCLLQQEAMQGLALAEPSSTEASPEGLQSTSSTEDFLVIHPDRVSAEGAYPDLPQWARRAPRSGLARPSTDRAEVGALTAV